MGHQAETQRQQSGVTLRTDGHRSGIHAELCCLSYFSFKQQGRRKHMDRWRKQKQIDGE